MGDIVEAAIDYTTIDPLNNKGGFPCTDVATTVTVMLGRAGRAEESGCGFRYTAYEGSTMFLLSVSPWFMFARLLVIILISS